MSLPISESGAVSSSQVSLKLPLDKITDNRETAEFLKAFAIAHGFTGGNEKCLEALAPFSMNALQALSKSELQQQIGSSVVGKLLFFQLTCKPPFRALSQPVEPPQGDSSTGVVGQRPDLDLERVYYCTLMRFPKLWSTLRDYGPRHLQDSRLDYLLESLKGKVRISFERFLNEFDALSLQAASAVPTSSSDPSQVRVQTALEDAYFLWRTYFSQTKRAKRAIPMGSNTLYPSDITLMDIAILIQVLRRLDPVVTAQTMFENNWKDEFIELFPDCPVQVQIAGILKTNTYMCGPDSVSPSCVSERFDLEYPIHPKAVDQSWTVCIPLALESGETLVPVGYRELRRALYHVLGQTFLGASLYVTQLFSDEPLVARFQ